MNPFYLLALGFKLWMLVDAIQRRVAFYWFMIIMIIPFGGVVYFFMYKIQDFDLVQLKKTLKLERPPSVEKLRLQLDRTPSLANRLALAQGLHDAGRPGDAIPLFEAVLEQEADNKEALLGLGLSHLETEAFDAAIEVLSKLVELDRAFQEFAAWPELAYAYYENGHEERCLELLAELVEISPRLKHQAAYAHYLILADRKAEARDVLEGALTDYEHAPPFVKRRSGRWARQARSMLKKL